LLFDGGYYIEAMTQLNNTQNLNQAEEVEKQYRMARIAHKTGEIAKAKAEYSKTIEMGKNMDLYYAANSALLLGNIFENEGNKEKAAEMYRLCLSLDFTTYRNSIRGLAKQHLSSLE
jgi:tetratricopeptide (TPR) repeat protein